MLMLMLTDTTGCVHLKDNDCVDLAVVAFAVVVVVVVAGGGIGAVAFAAVAVAGDTFR